ncbi:hypothetical protein BV898_07461 [Hypsibius exemplaris]|uniref:Uncharacterized protein n=1 Tax=Hypsibius exemplaris TaxID=2072580 RepID=A0A1W0WTD1_HYPEX|nr:hypothetical protein BV898_07461 [Hypsibius exemplaris]
MISYVSSLIYLPAKSSRTSHDTTVLVQREEFSGIITEQHSQLIANADEVKGAVRSAFGSYIEWLRNREAILLKSVDRAMEAHLARSQICLGDALSSLRVLKDSVELLDCDGTGCSVKDQIEKLVRDMTVAMEKDMGVTPVVRFEEKGQSALRSVIESCGEVFTESKNLFNPNRKTVTSSKWSSWLQSPTNLEHMEEPESWLPYDGDDLGVTISFAKMPSTQNLTATTPTGFTGKASRETVVFGAHFEQLMSTPLEQWLVPVLTKKRGERSCPGEIGHCAHVDANLEIENLDQLKCPSPVAKDLQTWLMPPDVVPLPPVAEVCRAGHPCATLAQCASPSDHCIGYFYTLSKRSEDWLSPLENNSDKCGDSSAFSSASSYGDEFEVLSWSCSSQAGRSTVVPVNETVREELKIWLKATSPPLSECEWLTDCCVESGCRSSHVQSGIQEWLMKTA